MTALRLVGLTKRYGETVAVDALDLEVRSGELLALLGPSGCGKTTTLRMVGGFVEPSAGQIWFDDREVSGLGPEKRPTAMVFQSYALWPHMSVAQNVGFGLRVRHRPKLEIGRRVSEALDLVGLPGMDSRYPRELSGGQQQRVALARALIVEPQVLLLDEPLSNLDAKLRTRMRADVRELQKRVKTTMLYVTHDQEEALSIADRVAVMQNGRIEQLAPPAELFENPRTPFVAGFIGHSNLLPAIVEALEAPDGVHAVSGGVTLCARACDELQVGAPIELVIRAHEVRLARSDETTNCLDGVVAVVSYLGTAQRVEVDTQVGRMLMDVATGVPVREGERIRVTLPQRSLRALGALR